jgi:HD domain
MITRRHMLFDCTCGCVTVATAGLASVATAAKAEPATGRNTLPSEIVGVRVPDSALAQTVTALVREASPEPLFNHVARSYVFGSKLGEARKLTFDPELLFLAAMMHDLGLTEKYMADARFEVDGADAAAKILRDHQYPEAKIDVAWQAIALHSTMEIPDRMLPEIALVHLGVFMDGGLNANQFPRAFFDEVFAALPRLNSRANFIRDIGAMLRKKPHTAYLAFEKDIALRTIPNYNPPNFVDFQPPAPFNQ